MAKKHGKNGSKRPSNGSEFQVTIDRHHLPVPEWTFPHVEIEMYATESKPGFPPVRRATKGAPNILLILLDDVGFGWMAQRTIGLEFIPDSPKPGRLRNRDALGRRQARGGRPDRRAGAAAMRHGDARHRHGLRLARVQRVCRPRALPVHGKIESVGFRFDATPKVTGMDRLEMATRMD